MNLLLRKEIRLLLPAWIAVLAAATLPAWPWEFFRGCTPIVFGAAALALSISSFGAETSAGTFGLMLVQPKDRRLFWRMKAGLLATAMLLAWLALVYFLSFRPEREWGNAVRWSGLLTLLALSGGLWTILLFRDVVTALLCSCVAPAILATVTIAVISHWLDRTAPAFSMILFCVLTVYGIAGIIWSQFLLTRAQDVPWTGGYFSFNTAGNSAARWLGFNHPQNRWLALVKKELQLQEVTLFLIPLFLFLYVAAVAASHYVARLEALRGFLLSGVPMLWLIVISFVIGAVSVAEERRLNTLEAQLCFPVSQRASFAVKFLVAMTLGVVLGGVIPWLLMRVTGPHDLEFAPAFWASLMVAGIAFYASTMSRGLLQAIPMGICGSVLAAVAGGLIFLGFRREIYISRGCFFEVVILPTMIITFLWLAFRNYKTLHTGWRMWLGNAMRAALVYTGILALAFLVYCRAWEIFIPLERPHGPARMAKTGATLAFANGALYIILPDGRLWIGRPFGGWKETGSFVPDGTWTKLAPANGAAAALRSDGTIWSLVPGGLHGQIGTDSDWSDLAGGGNGLFLAVKRDGTLWGWGNDHFHILKEALAGKPDQHSAGQVSVKRPIRVGPEADWDKVFILDSDVIGITREGEIHELVPAFAGRNRPWPKDGAAWKSFASSRYGDIGLRTDGTLWLINHGTSPSQSWKIFGDQVQLGPDFTLQRIGTKSDWVYLGGNFSQLAAVNAQGQLYAGWFSEIRKPSKYHDWLATTQEAGSTFALAADGTVSCWRQFGTELVNDFLGQGPLDLGPSRRPVFAINILDQSH